MTESDNEIIRMIRNSDSKKDVAKLERVLLERYDSYLKALIAKRYRSLSVEMREEMKQEALMKVYSAIYTFDLESGNKFITHATWEARGAMTAYFSQMSQTIRIPYQYIAHRKHFQAAHTFHEDDPNVTLKDIADTASKLSGIHISEEAMRRYEMAVISTGCVSISVDDGEDFQIPDNNENAENILFEHQVKTKVDKLLRQLKPREERSVRLYYGIGTNADRTIYEIGDIMQVSYETVRKDCITAVEKIKRKIKAEDLGL